MGAGGRRHRRRPDRVPRPDGQSDRDRPDASRRRPPRVLRRPLAAGAGAHRAGPRGRGRTGGVGVKFKAPLRPIHGADKIARFFVAVSGEALPPGSSVEIVEVNGGPAAVLVAPTGPVAMLQLDLNGEHRVTDIRLVGNPDKLRGLAGLTSDG